VATGGKSVDFEYYLEMYEPADKRRWGYFALKEAVSGALSPEGCGTLAVGNFENDRVLQTSRTREAEAPASTRQSPRLDRAKPLLTG
jgi:hypothetical protein